MKATTSSLWCARRSSIAAVVGVVLVGVLCQTGSAGSGLSYLGSTAWSGANGIELDGAYAYVSMANGLQILDISDPANARIISQVYLWGGYSIDIAKFADKVCVTGWRGQITVINVSDPYSPFILREYWTPASPVIDAPTCALTVDMQDSLMAVGWGSDWGEKGITVYNLNKPSNDPGITLSLEYRPMTLSMREGHIYCYDHTALKSIEILPETLVVLDSLDTEFATTNVLAPQGDTLLYLADASIIIPAGTSAFTIVNAADPSELKTVAQSKRSGLSADVERAGDVAYVAFGCGGVEMYDLTDLTSPSSIGTIDLNYLAGRLDIDGNILAIVEGPPIADDLTCSSWGLPGPPFPPVTIQFYDITLPAQPGHLGSYSTPATVTGLAVSGNIVCAINGGNLSPSVQVIDARESSKPEVVGLFNALGSPHAGAILDTLLYMATDSTLEIVNIADPSHPVLIGHGSYYEVTEPSTDIVIRSPYAFLASGFGLTVWDISDPTAPMQMGYTPLPGRAYSTALYGNLAYITMGYLPSYGGVPGISVVDISNPIHPSLLKVVDSSGTNFQEVAIGNGILFASDVMTGVLVAYSLSSPQDPIELRRHVKAYIADILIHNDYLYVTRGTSWVFEGAGVEVIDFLSEDSLVAVDSLKTPGMTFDIKEGGSRLFLANNTSMIILDGGIYTDIVESDRSNGPSSFSLNQNYPNPFNPTTVIEYDISRRGFVTLEIFNALGQQVKTLISQVKSSGHHKTGFNSEGLASGAYFYRLTIDGTPCGTKKMVLVK